MTVYLEDEQGFFEKEAGLYEKVQQVIAKCVEMEKVPYEVEVSLTVVGLEEIHSINKDYREVDRPTDVLSFPQIEPEAVGKMNWEDIDESECINFDTNQLMLGDIILCDEKAKEQAESYGHSLEREVCFLVSHSMFHLLGYDHMTEADEKVMFTKQEEVLELLKILR